jgi:cobalt-zinc-cadmium efflux system protein
MALHRDSSNGHLHGAGPLHEHAPKSFGFAFAFGTALNVAFVIVEAIFGFLGNSTALLADAGHNLSDVFGLLVAWGASVLSRRTPTTRYTYGLGSSSILAALFNAMFLLTAVGAIAWEAVQRLAHPVPVAGKTVVIVAAVGIAINGWTAWLFASGRKGDINIRGAFLHMAADAAVSAGVVVAGAIILLTGWDWVDPAMSLIICVEPDEVRSYLEQLPGVAQLHDLHIWPMSTTETALTCHVVMPGGHPGDEFLVAAAHELQHRFSIGHATIQIETSAATQCALESDKVV